MDNISVDTATSGIVKITYGNNYGQFKKYSKNLSNGNYVAEYWTDGKIESNLLCEVTDKMTYSTGDFSIIGGVAISDNSILFTQLEGLL